MDGEEVRRSYSICTGLDDGELRVAVKHVPGGRFSGWANTRLRVGDEVEVMTPSGRFTVSPGAQHAWHYLAIAAGSGITLVMSILRSVLARPGSRAARSGSQDQIDVAALEAGPAESSTTQVTQLRRHRDPRRLATMVAAASRCATVVRASTRAAGCRP